MIKKRKNSIMFKKNEGIQIPPNMAWLKKRKKEGEIAALPCLVTNKGRISSPTLIDLLKSEKEIITRA